MKHRISVLSILSVILAFCITVSVTMSAAPVVLADTTSAATKRSSDEQPYEEPTTKPTEPSSKPTEPSSKPTEPSSKPTEPSSKPTEPSSKPTEPSSKPTEPTNPTNPTNPTDPTDPTNPTNPTDPTASTSTTKKNNNPTTTKKSTKGKTTTRSYVPTQPRVTVSKMVVPEVQNTTQENAETRDPLDAYFERISNSTEAVGVAETTTEEAEPESESKLSTAAIVAICLIAVALVVVVLTVIFAVRNKRLNAQDEAAAYAGSYDPDDDIYADPVPKAEPTAADNDAFTVVSLDDKHYKD